MFENAETTQNIINKIKKINFKLDNQPFAKPLPHSGLPLWIVHNNNSNIYNNNIYNNINNRTIITLMIIIIITLKIINNIVL